MNEPELFDRAQAGDKDAFDTLVAQNRGLVVSQVDKRLKHRVPSSSLREDLIQEATIGLMAAIRKFDHRKGFRFSTYAINWIKEGIQKGVGNARLIHIPKEVALLLNGEVQDQVVEMSPLVEKAYVASSVSYLENIPVAESTIGLPEGYVEHQVSPEIAEAFEALSDNERNTIAVFYEFHEIPIQVVTPPVVKNTGKNIGSREVAAYFEKTEDQIKGYHRAGLKKIKRTLAAND